MSKTKSQCNSVNVTSSLEYHIIMICYVTSRNVAPLKIAIARNMRFCFREKREIWLKIAIARNMRFCFREKGEIWLKIAIARNMRFCFKEKREICRRK